MMAPNLQTLLALAVVLASALWFGRGLLRSLFGGGGCASGGSCGSCRLGGCDVSKFETIRLALEQERATGLRPPPSLPSRPVGEARS